ncbi:putative short chain dehydrogenase/reductase [Gordonia spumicola]|uniref:Putative short chain dehydrogenase/reductase n=1 Tax=Gordonia spumicola TaxID=589161 RepID=A0A7I9V327_9ACTN|nr:SDR family NAD(P)-dependent oxidoreductase [Gordonia spumicola]GED99804.1 putative short chain dehydrogenase/reductase [Gordonia spumicola]
MKVAGKVAVVTGAGGGIGAAIARKLVDEGAKVVLTDLHDDGLNAVVAELGDAAVGLGGDASAADHIAAVIALAEESFGPVGLYFANAGVGIGSELEFDDAVWDTVIDVNLRAHIRAAQQLIPGWVDRGEGYFVSTASAAGLLTQIGSAPYSVTKHAAVGFAEWLSVTYGDQGVRVSCLCPMGVNTKLLTDDASLSPTAARAVTTAGAVLEPSDVADAVLEAMDAERFLILPHPEVLDMYRHKGADYDRWIRGMRRFQKALRGD